MPSAYSHDGARGNGTADTIGNNLSDFVQTDWLVSGKVRTVQGVPVRGATVTVSPMEAVGTLVFSPPTRREEFRNGVRAEHPAGAGVWCGRDGEEGRVPDEKSETTILNHIEDRMKKMNLIRPSVCCFLPPAI